MSQSLVIRYENISQIHSTPLEGDSSKGSTTCRSKIITLPVLLTQQLIAEEALVPQNYCIAQKL